MKSPRETEIKLKVDDPRALKLRLKECGFVVVERRYFESNIVFDFRDSHLRKAHSLLRLRTKGSRYILTFKGPPHASNSYKIRTEIETEVDDGDALQQILEAVGLRSAFRYEKYRTAYAEKGLCKTADRPLLVYDETPIGAYIELEGPERWIDRQARRLGYQKEDYLRESYAALYWRQCRRNGVKPKDMVFSRNNSSLGSRKG
ncbi:MAG: class IV adenylate cyclase [Acidobacteriota bacterium]